MQSRRSAQSAASGKSSGSGKRSSVSSTSSACIRAEADLAALMARQKFLQDKHTLEEEEQQIQKRKERLKLDAEIAAHLAKVNVLRAASTSGSKNTVTDWSNAMNSYLKNEQGKTKFNLDTTPFITQRLETLKQQSKIMVSDQVTRLKSDNLTHAAHFQPPVHLPEIDSEVELLIGTNVSKALELLQVIRSVDDGPYAIKTILVWIVNGPLEGDNGNGMDVATVNRISVLNLEELWQQQLRTDYPEMQL